MRGAWTPSPFANCCEPCLSLTKACGSRQHQHVLHAACRLEKIYVCTSRREPCVGVVSSRDGTDFVRACGNGVKINFARAGSALLSAENLRALSATKLNFASEAFVP